MLFRPASPVTRKRLAIAAGVVLLVGGAVLFSLRRATAPRAAEESVKKEIAAANYCAVDDDCRLLYAPCPFGCWAAVNKNEADRIEGLMNDYRNRPDGTMCEYMCIAMEPVRCVNQKCEAKPDQTPGGPTRLQMEGTIVCLPHKTSPATDDCALGLRDDDGNHYVFDAALMSMTPPAYGVGDRIRAWGVFVPIEGLSTDHWQQYDVIGVFSATDSFDKL